ncbi:ATP-dependent DNA helicase PcrA [Candidatus Saccharibacteria bacterium]|nr:ATP-dependent DNA helicase PcrA [Candidatus Saccharibacteria bacterium]
MDILSGLNNEQRSAVTHGEGPLLILAGAGSGKTKTLTHRIAYLIQEMGVFPSKILAVTFTNKAAREMRERLARLLGESADNRGFMPWMGTFHSICVRLLRQDGMAIHIPTRFVIYDEDDKLGLIRQIMKQHGLTDRDIKPRAIAAAISKAKNALLTAQDFADGANGPIEQKKAEIFLAYQTQLQKAGALDFDDLLVKTVELFRTQKDIRKKWQQQFRHILIDEYQDTNAVQYALVKLLVNEQRNICVVGDDAQSIYSFRGADYTNILNFERDFPGTTVVKLEQNYRSTDAILTLANTLIQHNIHRTDKNLWTALEGGREPVLWQVYNESEEGMHIAQEIVEQANAGRAYSDMAVLYRTNAQSYAIERALRERYIPHKIVGGLRFLDRAVVKDLMAYMRLLFQPNDRVSFTRIVNVPKRGIGAVSVQKFLTWHDTSEGSIIDHLAHVHESDGLTPKAKSALKELGDTLSELQQKIDNSPADLLEAIIEKTGYLQFINDGSPQADERMENVGVLIAEAKVYADTATFLEEMALMSSSDETADDQVTLMTLHAAKGLEFPVVFLVGMEEGILPHTRVFDSGKPDDIEEERRLCYVGITRAREELFVTCANSRTQFGQIGYNMPSRFLAEMGLSSDEAPTRNTEEIVYDEFFGDELILQPGDRVRTPLFGPGEVTEVDGMAVVVEFDTGQVKKLNAEFARLEKL